MKLTDFDNLYQLQRDRHGAVNAKKKIAYWDEELEEYIFLQDVKDLYILNLCQVLEKCEE